MKPATTLKTIIPVFALVSGIWILLFSSNVKASGYSGISSGEDRTVYAGAYILENKNSTITQVIYVDSGGSKIVKEKVGTGNWNVNFVYTDQVGSTSFNLDSNGNITSGFNNGGNLQKLRYFAYGSQIQGPSSNILPTADTYTGQKEESELDLMYYNARYYDPTRGRFIQADSVSDGFNRYMYVAGNPVSFNDTSGHYTDEGNDIVTNIGGSVGQHLYFPIIQITNPTLESTSKIIFPEGGTFQTPEDNSYVITGSGGQKKTFTNINFNEDQKQTVKNGFEKIPAKFINDYTIRVYCLCETMGTNAPPAAAYPDTKSIELYNLDWYRDDNGYYNESIITHEAYHIYSVQYMTDYLGTDPVGKPGEPPMYGSGMGLTIDDTVRAILYMNGEDISDIRGARNYSGIGDPNAYGYTNSWEYGAETTRNYFYPGTVTDSFVPDKDVEKFLKYLYTHSEIAYPVPPKYRPQ